MKTADIKRIKHREVERVRHNQLQKLIAKLSDQIPDDCPIKNTQCSILSKTKNYIEFLLAEYARISAIVEVESYSSSQGTASSSQGPLVIDEDADNPVGDPYSANNEHESNTLDFEPKVEMPESKLEFDLDPEIITDFKYDYSFPSFLLSPDREPDHYDHFASMQQPQQPVTTFNGYSSHQYQSPPSFYSSQPVTSTFSYNNYHQHHHPQQQNPQQIDQKIVTTNHHRTLSPHCSSCSCFNPQPKFFDFEAAEKTVKNFFPRDHLLPQTISDVNFVSESSEWF